nr:reverse transcriptase domain-containing protein [Tanacetum cinerariifolium]
NETESERHVLSSRSRNDTHTDNSDINSVNDKQPMAEEQVFANAALKNELRKSKGNSVDTKFAKSSILGKPVLQPPRNQLVVRQSNAFKSEQPNFSKTRFASQVDVNNVLSKPVTPHYLPKVRESAPAKPHHVNAPSSSRNSKKELYGSNDMTHNYYLEEDKKKSQDKNRNLKPKEMPFAKTHHTPNACTPKPKSNNQTSRNWPASKSNEKTLKDVLKAIHSRDPSSFSDFKHFVCSTCQKCVFNANHDACITNFLKEDYDEIPKRPTMYLNLWSYKAVRHRYSNPIIQPEVEGSTQGYSLVSVEVLRRSNRRHVPNIIEPEIRTIEELVLMADHTMEELFQAPTEGYGEAIVIPEILAENLEIKTNFLQDNVNKTDDRIDKLADQISNLVEIVNKQVITLASAKAVEKTFVTCGGAHAYYDCIATDTSTSGTNPSNTVPNPKGEMKAVTTRSGLAYEGPSIPTNSPLEKKLHEKATNQMENFFQIFHDFQFNISFTDALLLMPKFASSIKSLLTNKDKLFELAKVPLNENCSTMLLKKLPEKLEDLDVIDIGCEESVKDVLDFQYNSKSSNPTLVSDPLIYESDFSKEPIVKSSSLTLTPFIEKTKAKSSVEEPPELDLKELPSYLEYAFLEESNKLPVTIAKNLKDFENEALIKVFKSHKRAISWKISDIKSINLRFCTHKILIEEDYKPVVQSQRRVNHKIHDVIKKEVFKLLDASMIYPISDSPWVSPIYCVPKKGGMTVVANENNDLIPTRLVTGWRVFIDYRKLNDATRKDHFSVPFMDQMLERLAGNEFYCFLDGFSRYFQIPIDPQDQEKTTFICPYGTFAYRRMPIGLCNALENPHKDVLENKDINENFSLETLGSLSCDSTPCDRGTHFCNDQFTRVMIKYRVTYRLATAYHPQTSGQVEVSNHRLKRILERTIEENCASWSDKLDDVLRAFRTAFKTPIGCTPYKLVYGKSCHLPIELEHRAYWALKHVNFDLKTVGDHRKLQLNKLNELRDQAYENYVIYKEKTKKLHDSKIKNRIFNVGDQVLLFKSRLKIFSGKLKTRWSGPFTITQVFPYGTVELSQPNGPNFKVNGHCVKHYFGGDIPSKVVPDLHTFPMDK